MKRRRDILRVRETLNLIDIHSRHINCIRLHKSTNKEHRAKMFEICSFLIDNNHQFITEAKFVSGGRCDIVVLDEQVAIEILNTEDKNKFNKKQYPILTVAVGVDEEWRGL